MKVYFGQGQDKALEPWRQEESCPIAYAFTNKIAVVSRTEIDTFTPKAILTVRQRLVQMELEWHQNMGDYVGWTSLQQFLNEQGPEPREGFYRAAVAHMREVPYKLHPKLKVLAKKEDWLTSSGKLRLPVAMIIRESPFVEERYSVLLFLSSSLKKEWKILKARLYANSVKQLKRKKIRAFLTSIGIRIQTSYRKAERQS